MYEKNLKEDLRLRLSENDMNFLRDLSSQRGITISETIRSIIGEYRRTIDTSNTLSQAIPVQQNEEEQLFNGNTKTDIDN